VQIYKNIRIFATVIIKKEKDYEETVFDYVAVSRIHYGLGTKC
jgi:hypothetical protein